MKFWQLFNGLKCVQMAIILDEEMVSEEACTNGPSLWKRKTNRRIRTSLCLQLDKYLLP